MRRALCLIVVAAAMMPTAAPADTGTVCIRGSAAWSIEVTADGPDGARTARVPVDTDQGDLCQRRTLERINHSWCTRISTGNWQGSGAYRVRFDIPSFTGDQALDGEDNSRVRILDIGESSVSVEYPYGASGASESVCNSVLRGTMGGAYSVARSAADLQFRTIDGAIGATARFRPGAGILATSLTIGAGEHLCATGRLAWRGGPANARFSFDSDSVQVCDGAALPVAVHGQGAGPL